MTEKAKCVCQNCKAEILVDYIRLGLAALCYGCLQYTVPKIPNGERIPACGISITYIEFKSLLADLPAQNDILKFLDKNYSYSIKKIEDDFFITNENNEAIDPLWLHLKIQADPKLQGDLYNLAMSIWRS